MRPIDADTAKKALTCWFESPTDEDIEYAIDKLPTLDYAPVVHGYWKHEEPVKDDGQKPFVCSSCGLRHPRYGDVDKAYFFHCPWCGIPMDAKMDGGKNDVRITD